MAARQLLRVHSSPGAGPQLFDIVAACAYLATALQPWIAVILLVTLISYIPLTVYLTEWRGRFRRCRSAAAGTNDEHLAGAACPRHPSSLHMSMQIMVTTHEPSSLALLSGTGCQDRQRPMQLHADRLTRLCAAE